VGLGALAYTGDAQPWFHAVTPELEVQWLEPFHLGTRWRTGFHARAGGWRGTVEEQTDQDSALPITAGSAAVGTSLGARWKELSFGPQAELLVPWRIFEDYDASGTMGESAGLGTTTQRQMQATGAVGARMLWTTSMGAQVLALRLDSRWAPYTVDADRLGMWHHGVSLSWAPSPRR
jgi:hypothetical protein